MRSVLSVSEAVYLALTESVIALLIMQPQVPKGILAVAIHLKAKYIVGPGISPYGPVFSDDANAASFGGFIQIFTRPIHSS